MTGSEIPSGQADQGLKKALGTGFVLAVVIGGVIGLGILRTPGEIAAVVPDPFQYLSMWVLGGAFVLLSTVVTAELVGMTPRSGGTYPLVRHAYGPYSGFVIGWVDWLSFVADIALKAVVVMEFIALLLPATLPCQTALAIAVTSLFAALQLRGVRSPRLEPRCCNHHLYLRRLLYAAYFSGEIKDGGGAIARTCVKGLVVVIALYLLLNAPIAWSVPLSSVAGSELALAQVLELAISPTAAAAVVVTAVLILLSHQNLGYLGASQILHALAVDGLASKRAQRVGRGGNPIVAVLATWLLSVGLILVGGFELLLHLCVSFFVMIYLVLIAGVAILRRREPESDRPY